MKTTVYYEDFLRYYDKAKTLQEINLASANGRDVTIPWFDDPLMQWVTIYDCVERRYAGFSNALQQVFLGSDNPKRWQADPVFDGWRDRTPVKAQMWLCLWHRVTGSGASFSHDHGFRNSQVRRLAGLKTMDEMCEEGVALIKSKTPCFTSIGNQIPPFPKPVEGKHERGSERYFEDYSKQLVTHVDQLISHSTWPIKEVVKDIEWWCRSRHLKMFRFVYTAWVMDLAEYWPHVVEPRSHVHYGKNALESLGLMFEDFHPKLVDQFMEQIMSDTGNDEPMSLEDVLCDYVRYIERYVPKGYEHLEPWQVQNASIANHPVRHPSYMKIMEKVHE